MNVNTAQYFKLYQAIMLLGRVIMKNHKFLVENKNGQISYDGYKEVGSMGKKVRLGYCLK